MEKYRSRLETLTQNLTQIIVYIDEKGRVISHNPRLADILSPGISNITGEILLPYLHPWDSTDAADLAKLFAFPLSNLESRRNRYNLSLKNSWSGRSIYTCEMIRAYEGDVCNEYCLIFNDVTSLRQLEEEYRRVQRIHMLLPVIRGFSRDYKERMMVMYGNVDYAREILSGFEVDEDTLLPALRESYNSIIHNLQHTNKKLDSILLLSEGRENLGREFSIEDCIREASDQIVTGTGKIIEYRIEDDLPAYPGDYPKILQMIQNIVLNAIQASPDSRPIQITAEVVRHSAGQDVVITVADHGPGMTIDVLKRAEQPFFTTRTDSAGLGLFVAKNIALEHNGSLTIESQPGKGTRVHINLPSDGREQSNVPQVQLPHGLKILILDPNSEVQDIWERLLYQLGVQGYFVKSTFAALEAFEAASESDYPFHMVILEDNESDIPDVYNLLSRLRKIQDELPAIYCSYTPNRIALDEMRKLGFSTYLRKPFRLTDLQEALQRAATNFRDS